MKMIKHVVRTIAVVLCGALLFASCANDIETAEDAPAKGAYLRATAQSNARSTLFPAYEREDFTKYTLQGTYTTTIYDTEGSYSTEHSTALGEWKSYSDFENAYIALPATGTWNFVLDAYTSNGTYFTASVSTEIVDGANPISFQLKAKKYALDSDSLGGFSASFEISGASYSVENHNNYSYIISDSPANTYTVHAVVKKGEDLASAEQIDSQECPLALQLEYDGQSDYNRYGFFEGIKSFTGNFKATITKSELEAGYYWVIFSLDKGTISGIITKSVLVIVADGKLSTEETGTPAAEIVSASDVATSDAKVTFTIEYDYDGGSIVEAGYVPPATYSSRDTVATVLPTANQIARDGFTFLGWKRVNDGSFYPDYDENGNYIEYTTRLLNVSGNRRYQAMWQWDSSQTVTITSVTDTDTPGTKRVSWTAAGVGINYAIYTYRSSLESVTSDYVIANSGYYPTIDTYFDISNTSTIAYVYVVVQPFYDSSYGIPSEPYQIEKYVLQPPVVQYQADSSPCLYWDSVPLASYYKVYSIISDTKFDTNTLTKADFTSSETVYNTKYFFSMPSSGYVYFAVESYNSSNEASDTISNILRLRDVPTPVAHYDGTTLSWDSIAIADSYRVYTYRSTVNYDSFDTALFSTYEETTETSYAITNDVEGDYLYVAVQAVADDDLTPWSNVIKIMTPATAHFTNNGGYTYAGATPVYTSASTSASDCTMVNFTGNGVFYTVSVEPNITYSLQGADSYNSAISSFTQSYFTTDMQFSVYNDDFTFVNSGDTELSFTTSASASTYYIVVAPYGGARTDATAAFHIYRQQ